MRRTVERGLDVVGDAKARLSLVGAGEAVVEVFAEAEVEVPVAGLDLVFSVEREFLDVGVAEVIVECCRRG